MVKRWIPYILMVVLAVAIAGMLLYIIPYRYRLDQTTAFTESGDDFVSPMTGFAPPAESEKNCADTQLVFINLTWAEWEPTPGAYNIKGMEEKFHIARWKEENKHAVLRFVCDIPSKTAHRDIPDWLYNRTGDGVDYDVSYGKGYSPNYENGIFRQAHTQAIAALADYCNKDLFVSYVELGSVGHWGEWHTASSQGANAMPGDETLWSYVLDYSNSFRNARILMRQNFRFAEEPSVGLYNDMLGHEEDTARWLDNLTRDDPDYRIPRVAMPDRWKTAPVGGEFTSSIPMETMLSEDLPKTLDMVRNSHMTFVGPKCPNGEERKLPGADAVLSRLGYRFYISQLQTHYSFRNDNVEITLTWENTGNAPIYWDWPVTVYVYDKDGELMFWKGLDMALSQLMPEESMTVQCAVPFSEHFREGYSVGVAITSPDGSGETITLAQEPLEVLEGNIQVLYRYE